MLPWRGPGKYSRRKHVILADRPPTPRPRFHRTRTAPLGALLALTLVPLLGACGRAGEPDWPAADALVVALPSAPLNLDPRVGSDAASGRVFELVLDGLVTKDRHGNLIPDLARSWEILDGGRRYRFHLRPGVRFHDGRELTAEDVAWTFRTLIDGSVATTKKGAFTQLERVEAIDPLTVDFHLSEPFGSFLTELTPFQGIVPSGTTPEEMNRRPVGTGPFRFVRRTPEEVVLERNPDYWAGAPYLEGVVLKEVPDATVRVLELMKGSVQLVVNDLPPDIIPRFRKDPRYRVVEEPGANYAYLGINLDDPILRHVRVRRAMAHAIDRQRLVDTLWRGLGVVTETMLPPGLWARNDDIVPYRYDPAEARRLLDQAGYPDPDGPGGEPRFTITYKTSTNEPYVLQAQVIQQMLAEVGIRVEIRSYEFATLYADVTKGNFQLFSLVRTGVIDPNIYQLTLASWNVPPQGQNRGHYHNAEFDRLIREAARLTDRAARRPLYLKAQEIFARDLPYISLYTRVNVAVMPALLEGYVSYPSGELLSLRKVYWNRPGQRPPRPEASTGAAAPD